MSDWPVGEGWEVVAQWRRSFLCVCGYYGWEYWNKGVKTTHICTRCGMGRPVEVQAKSGQEVGS